MTSTPTKRLLLWLLAAVATLAAAKDTTNNKLRTRNNENNNAVASDPRIPSSHRHLQFGGIVSGFNSLMNDAMVTLNPVVETFRRAQQFNFAPILNGVMRNLSPLMEGWIETQLANYSEFTINRTETTNFDEKLAELCTTQLNLTYGVGTVHGLNVVLIHDIEMIPETEYLDISFWGLNGADWGGEWRFNGTFPNVTVESSVELEGHLCGVPIKQTATGVLHVKDFNWGGTVRMDGKTENLYSFFQGDDVLSVNSVSTVTPVAKEVILKMGGAATEFAVAGSIVDQPTFRVMEMERTVLETFSTGLEPFLMNVVNGALEEHSPLAIYDTHEEAE